MGIVGETVFTLSCPGSVQGSREEKVQTAGSVFYKGRAAMGGVTTLPHPCPTLCSRWSHLRALTDFCSQLPFVLRKTQKDTGGDLKRIAVWFPTS